MSQKHSASERREQFRQSAAGGPRPRKPWPLMVVAGVLLAGLVALIAGRTSSVPGPEPVQSAAAPAAGADVVLDAAQFEDGRARFFTYAASSGRDVRFFVMKSADGVIRAALDSCDVCFREKKGYRQEGDAMICNNCGQSFPSNLINVMQGGCNPAPLERLVADGRVVVRAASLEQGVSYF